MPPIMRDQGKRNMFWPKVLGQAGTASPAPMVVTRPPSRMSTNVAAAVTTASRCASMVRLRLRPSVGARSRPGQRRLRLRQELVLRFGIAVLVGAAVHGRDLVAPVEVRGW